MLSNSSLSSSLPLIAVWGLEMMDGVGGREEGGKETLVAGLGGGGIF